MKQVNYNTLCPKILFVIFEPILNSYNITQSWQELDLTMPGVARHHSTAMSYRKHCSTALQGR